MRTENHRLEVVLDMSDSEDEAVERQVKVALVGAPQVGKTSLALRYTQDTVNKIYQVRHPVQIESCLSTSLQGLSGE